MSRSAANSTSSQAPVRSTRGLLLVRRGLVFVESVGDQQLEIPVRGLELELAALGYVLSIRLRRRLLQSSLDELVGLRNWLLKELQAHRGAGQQHAPLFRHFPDGVPRDTREVWWQRVLVHFAQTDGQPCLFCKQRGTTHVLSPCEHVVCSRCFDGSNYGACPVCGCAVDLTAPFFLPSAARAKPKESVVFELLDCGEQLDAAARAYYVALCERKQALSPDDRAALVTLVTGYGLLVLSWLPPRIPVRENVALVFGTLASKLEPSAAFEAARAQLISATDVLRFLAVYSGTDGSLQPETVLKQVNHQLPPSRFLSTIARVFGVRKLDPKLQTVTIPQQVKRFKMARLSRALRRSILAQLESFPPDTLIEDFLRHSSYWVWAGEFLHPHEYAGRFPQVARAFAVVRGRAPGAAPSPPFRGFYSRVEGTLSAGELVATLELLAQRPGELARRLDHLLRKSNQQPGVQARILATFEANVPKLATPLLVQLQSHLAHRASAAPIRVYWPKSKTALGVSAADVREPLPVHVIERVVAACTQELLTRFGAKAAFESAILDAELANIIVPFNERTASPAAVALPRGSSLHVSSGKFTRLFLHWCQPERGGYRTDLDLSVALYDRDWRYLGVCSYYGLQAEGAGGTIAKSSGDRQDAPWPNGATEFVDIYREPALAAGVHYAVMVVNAFSGMPFSKLKRAFAGLMLREDLGGEHFDPRTVELKFALQGERGVYLPLVLDLPGNQLHWLDVHATGELLFNNVESSKKAIVKLCPELISYFASGARPNLLELARLHAAARCPRVFVRGPHGIAEFVRRPNETPFVFLERLRSGSADEPRSQLPSSQAAQLALLARGDLELAPNSSIYALFRDNLLPTLSASDLLS